MATKLHIGKLDHRIETSVTELMAIWIAEKAHAMGLREADFVRELIWLGATQKMYSMHVANDKAEQFTRQLATLPEDSGR